MRFLLLLVLLVAALMGGVWLGGESWLASRATTVIGESDDLSASAVTPLRQVDRVGVRADEVDFAGQLNGAPLQAKLPWVEFWVPPTAPNTVHASLPAEMELVLDNQLLPVGLQGAEGVLRISPMNEMAITHARIAADEVQLQGRPVVQGLSARADLVSLGHDAPLRARAAYDVTGEVASLDPGALTPVGLPALAVAGDLSVAGDMRLWLTDAINPGNLQGQAPAPQLAGFRTEGLALSVGDLQARIVGLIGADAQGRATGRLALYTTDAQDWLQALADAGIIPPAAVMLAKAMIGNLSGIPMEPEDEAAPDDNPMIGSARLLPTGFDFPEPAEGEVRIPLFLQDGQMRVGTLPLGPAPRLIGG